MDVRHAETEAPDLSGLRIHEPSVTRHEGALYCLVEGDGGQRRLAVLAPAGSPRLAGFDGEHSALGENTLLLGPLSAQNAAALRSRLAWLRATRSIPSIPASTSTTRRRTRRRTSCAPGWTRCRGSAWRIPPRRLRHGTCRSPLSVRTTSSASMSPRSCVPPSSTVAPSP